MKSPSRREASSFDAFHLHPILRRAVQAAGYREPRPIQTATIPAAMEGRDVLGLAQTGTGKTAAFALPVLQRLLERRGPGPRVIVLAPTRELAVQIDSEIRALAQGTRIRTVTVYGGVSERPQIRTLARRPEIVVACPGRFLDLLGRRELRVDRVDTLILDEADHMFDMGFLPDIRRIIGLLPDKRQNLLFAATMPADLRKLVGTVLRDPVVAELAHSMPAETIDHALYPIQEKRKMALLERVLEDGGPASSIVFTRTKHRAKRLAAQLEKRGVRAVALQGNMSQGARDRAMRGFRESSFDVLVATDIAARGLDIERVARVINFDVPNTPDAYTHRIGRTGRSERKGRAYTFVAENDLLAIEAIERRIGVSIDRRMIEGFEGMRFPLPTRRDRRAAQPPAAGRGRRRSSRGAPRSKHPGPDACGRSGRRQRSAGGGAPGKKPGAQSRGRSRRRNETPAR